MAGAGNTGRYGVVRHDSAPVAPAEDPGQVTLQHGKFRVSMPVAFAIAALTCAGGYGVSRAQKPAENDPSALLVEFRAAMATQNEEQRTALKALGDRIDSMQTELKLINIDIRAINRTLAAKP